MKTLCFILLIVLANACAAPHFANFSKEVSINDTLFSKFTDTKGNPLKYSEVKVYVAHLEETLIERDAVGERRIRNDQSETPTFPVAIGDKQYDLFFFRFKVGKDFYGVMLSTAYDEMVDSLGYLGLGPAFYGPVRINQLNAFRKLEVKRYDSVYAFVPAKKEMKINIYFIADKNLANEIGNSFEIKQIVQAGSNKIAGSKPIVFDIEKVFRDPKALMFVYDEELTKKFKDHGK